MKSSTTKIMGTIVLGAAISLTGACGSEGIDGNGDTFLSIVGDRNVYLESGEQAELTVRYHDKNDEPLAGTIEFAFDGETSGAQLTTTTATTDDDGVAAVTLNGSNDQQASFYVEASAPGAGRVTWNITIEEPAGPADPNGSYRVDSNLDLVTGLEGTVGDVVNTILDITTDPGTYLLLRVSEQCCIDESQARSFGPVLTGLLRDQAPELVGEILDLGELLDDNLKNFAVVSELTVSGSGGTRDASHAVTGVSFKLESETSELTMSDLGQDPIEVGGVSLSFEEESDGVTVGDHELPLSYGAMLSIGIESVLIPAIDDTADDLGEFLNARIDCKYLSELVADEFDFGDGTRSLIEAGCVGGINYVANEIMNRIEEFDDTGFALILEGAAEAEDTNRDGKADVLVNGKWEGRAEYGNAAATSLDPADNKFTGARLD